MAADGFYCLLVDYKHFARGKKTWAKPFSSIGFFLSFLNSFSACLRAPVINYTHHYLLSGNSLVELDHGVCECIHLFLCGYLSVCDALSGGNYPV